MERCPKCKSTNVKSEIWMFKCLNCGYYEKRKKVKG